MSLHVHIWSDIACPWCYVGQKRLLMAADTVHVELEVEWHSFELNPSPVAVGDTRDYVQRLADKYRKSRIEAQGMVDQMKTTGAALGIEFHFDKAIPANTFLAHRLLHLAKENSLVLQSELKRAFLDAHFTDGKDLNDVSTLVGIAALVGIDVDRASSVLATDEFAAEVRADEEQARQLDITGVPFFIIGKQGVGGAQKPELFEKVIREALADQEATSMETGALCTPESC